MSAPVESISFASKDFTGTGTSSGSPHRQHSFSKAVVSPLVASSASSDMSSETSSLSGDEEHVPVAAAMAKNVASVPAAPSPVPPQASQGLPKSFGLANNLVVKCGDGTKLGKVKLRGQGAKAGEKEVIVLDDIDQGNLPADDVKEAAARPVEIRAPSNENWTTMSYDSESSSSQDDTHHSRLRRQIAPVVNNKLTPREKEIVSMLIDIPGSIKDSPYEPDEHAEANEPLFARLKNLLLPASPVALTIDDDQTFLPHDSKKKSVRVLFDRLTPFTQSSEFNRPNVARGRRRLEPTQEAVEVFGKELATTMVATSQTIVASLMLFGSTWQNGEFTKAKFKPLPLPLLLLCLQEPRLSNAFDVGVMDIMVADLGVYDLVANLLDEWDMCELFPRLAGLLEPHPTTKKRSIPAFATSHRLECHKSAIFVARAYQCVEVLKPESINPSLTEKIESCLAILSEHALDPAPPPAAAPPLRKRQREDSEIVYVDSDTEDEEDDDDDEMPEHEPRRPLELCARSGMVLYRFESVNEASEATGIDREKLSNSASAAPPENSDLFWRYVPNEEDEDEGNESDDDDEDNDHDNQKMKQVTTKSSPPQKRPKTYSKSVEQLCATTGKLLNTYKSISAASRDHDLPRARFGEMMSLGPRIIGKNFWRLAGSTELPSGITKKVEKTVIAKLSRPRGGRKPVERRCIKTGQLLGRYRTISGASEACGINRNKLGDIVVNGPAEYAGFIWQYSEDLDEEKKKVDTGPPINAKSKPVERRCIKTGQLLEKYTSISGACQACGLSRNKLGELVVNGPGEYAGFIWQYAPDYYDKVKSEVKSDNSRGDDDDRNEKPDMGDNDVKAKQPTDSGKVGPKKMPPPAKSIPRKKAFPIEQSDIETGRVINVFRSMRQAVRYHSYSRAQFFDVMKAPPPVAYEGFNWRLIGSDEEVSEDKAVSEKPSAPIKEENKIDPSNEEEEEEEEEDIYEDEDENVDDESVFEAEGEEEPRTVIPEGLLENMQEMDEKEKEKADEAVVFPGDENEKILNLSEIEVAWLAEESMYCYDQDEIAWNFCWTHASPCLKVDLRKIGANQDDPLKELVRFDNPHVLARFEALRRGIHRLLREGQCRESMTYEIQRAQGGGSGRKALSSYYHGER